MTGFIIIPLKYTHVVVYIHSPLLFITPTTSSREWTAVCFSVHVLMDS